MANPWKKKVIAYNRALVKDREAAQDLMVLINALPPGQRRQLLRDEVCSAILRKYGITDD